MEKNKYNVILPDIYKEKYKSSSPTPIKLSSNNSKENFKDAYQKVDFAKGLLNDRIEKLDSERKLLHNFKKPILGINRGIGNGRFSNGYDNFYDINFLNASRNRINQIPQNNYARMPLNPYINNPQQPLYYPLEMPIKGEPLRLPDLELGRPIKKDHKIGGIVGGKTGLTAKDLILILLAGNGQINPMLFGNIFGDLADPGKIGLLANTAFQKSLVNNNDNDVFNNVPRSLSYPTKPLLNPININSPNTTNRRDKNYINRYNNKRYLWRIVRNFTLLHKFYYISLNYSRNARKRDSSINEVTKQILVDLDILKSWIIEIQKDFFNELSTLKDKTLNIDRNISKVALKENYQKILVLLNIFIKSLFKIVKENLLPQNIQEIIYKYIKPNAIFPRKYLTTFEINRLEFYFYGGLKDVNDSRAAMIISYFVLSRCFIQIILLHIHEVFLQYKDNQNVIENALLIGSILHYIINLIFSTDPPLLMRVIGTINYYRNCHIFNKVIEENSDVARNLRNGLTDKDELKDSLLSDDEISKFIEDNQEYIERFKGFLKDWSLNVARSIKEKNRNRE